MTTALPGEEYIQSFRDRVRGQILAPGDEGYDAARTVWNAMVDRRPALIAQCAGTADVIAAVDFARKHDVLLSVKGGGHHVAGTAVCDDGLMIDLSEMNAVRVDPRARTARVQAGASWGDVDHETQAFGLATPGGQDPNIGVAGLTLGGGSGWLSRKYGLTIDNLLEVDLVTAAGEFVHASESENPDLFWGVRGGGGNFGIATAFKYRLHEVGPEVLAGSLFYPLDQAREVAEFYREFMAGAPDELQTFFGMMELPAASYLPRKLHRTRASLIVSFYAGDPDDGTTALAPLRQFGDPAGDTIRPRPYMAFQRAGTSADVWRTYLRSQYLERVSGDTIDTIVEHSASAPSSECTVFVSHQGGAETEPAVEATAYPHREEAFHVLVEARWDDPTRDSEHVAWVREFHDALRPETTGAAAMNFLTDDESEARVKAAYGPNYDRLVTLKNEWDPGNLFRMNQNIEPTA